MAADAVAQAIWFASTTNIKKLSLAIKSEKLAYLVIGAEGKNFNMKGNFI